MTDYFIQRFDYLNNPFFNQYLGTVFNDQDNIVI